MKKKAVLSKDKQLNTGTIGAFKGRNEKDIDDLVHSGEEEILSGQTEEDPDDSVHQVNWVKSRQTNQQNNLADPDDLVHDYRDENDEP